jgi:methylphosphotriester-DNA--protein-cysteine methyltransferase
MKSGISQKLKKQRIYNMNEQQLRDLIAQTEATKLPGYQTTLKMLRRRLQELILDKQTTASGINKDPDSGLFIAPDGRSYETLEEAEMAVEEEERKGKLDTAKAESQQSIEELERLIKGSGARQKALAERVGARQQGQLLSQLERSILGSGGDAQVVGALTPQIQEQGERSLLDRVQGIEANTLGRLTQVPQLELGNITDMAQLGQAQQRISDARTQALMAEETRRAQIQAGFDSQPEWWEGVLGAVGTGLGTAVGGPIGGAIGGALINALTPSQT